MNAKTDILWDNTDNGIRGANKFLKTSKLASEITGPYKALLADPYEISIESV